MKKIKIIIIILIIFAIGLATFYGIKKYKNYLVLKNAKVEIKLNDDLILEFLDTKKVSDYIKSINGKIIDDYEFSYDTLGKKKINFKFINDDGIKIPYSYEIEVIDTTPPVVWLNDYYNVSVGSDVYFYEKIMCGDNYDDNPTCYVEGNYDLNTVGSYNATFIARDSSGNETKKDFTLKVYNPSNNSYTPTKTVTYFSDVVKNYKKENTKIGIDVSGWQGDIDFEAIKNAGVEFIIIKVGGTKGTLKDYYVDSKFIQNIENANKYGIDVGLYMYTYSGSSKEAIDNAKWLLEQIKGYDVKLPIAFDWEDFGDYNSYNMSFYHLTKMAEDFIKEVEKEGYTGMLYGSKNYLEKIWLPTKYDVWLAHYTSNTSYQGKYKFWQICDDGVIPGIKGAVDIDILYE